MRTPRNCKQSATSSNTSRNGRSRRKGRTPSRPDTAASAACANGASQKQPRPFPSTRCRCHVFLVASRLWNHSVKSAVPNRTAISHRQQLHYRCWADCVRGFLWSRIGPGKVVSKRTISAFAHPAQTRQKFLLDHPDDLQSCHADLLYRHCHQRCRHSVGVESAPARHFAHSRSNFPARRPAPRVLLGSSAHEIIPV